MTLCRKCGAPILFLQSTKGHQIPCDPEPITVPAGNPLGKFYNLVQTDGRTIHTSAPGTQGFISHFATCPAADQFRKKKKGAERHDQLSREVHQPT